MSWVLVLAAAYAATMRRFGFVSMQDSGFFIGVCIGPFFISAILVLGFYAIRKTPAHYSAKLLALSCGASFFALLTLLGSAQIARQIADPALAPPSGNLAHKLKPKSAHVPTIWDPAIIALYTDLKSYNEAYVGEVSQLDLTAQPLYTPPSFRDAATIQQRLAQLQARLVVAEKYASPQPLLGKMNGYVAAINASNEEKQQFLAKFMPAAQEMVARRTAAGGYERDWLNSSIAAYQFMLANQGSYTISADGTKGTFKNPGLAKSFNDRLKNIFELKQKFLSAHGAYLASQRAAREQAGMEP